MIEVHDCMLSTTDNPYDPFTQYDEWYAFDTQMNYNSCAYLARIAMTSPAMTSYEAAIENERAIDEIVSMNLNGKYIKVMRPSQ